jgi:type VI protein secretion system component Hcp
MKRLYTSEELDALMKPEGNGDPVTVNVDSVEHGMFNALLTGVYVENGWFDVYRPSMEEDEQFLTLNLKDCKVFVLD